MNDLIKDNKRLIALALVFVIFAFFRFTNLHLRIPFAWDHEQFSTQVRDIVIHHKLTLLGPRVTDDHGFFLAPYFTYALVPFYLITGLHPNALIIFLITINSLFFFVTYYALSKLFHYQSALLFLLLWSINPLLIEYDTNPWWPLLIPLGVITIWLLLYQLTKTKKLRYWILTGFALGFFLNMHFQFIFIIGFTGIFLVIHYRTTFPQIWWKCILMVGAFALMFSPLLIFDLRHEYLNTHLFLSYFTERMADHTVHPSQWQNVFTNVILPLTKMKNPFITPLFFFSLISILVYLAAIKKHFQRTFYLASVVLVILTIIGFILYHRRPSEYYFVYLYPLIYIVLTEFLFSFKKRYVIALVYVSLAFVNMNELKKSLNAHSNGLYYKDKVVQQILPYTHKRPVSISYDMPLGTNNGYQYLFDVYNIKSSGEKKDPLIQIRVPPHKGDMVIHQIGISIPKELK